MAMMSVHISSGLVLHQMTSAHNRSELGIQDHNNEQSSLIAGVPKSCSLSKQGQLIKTRVGLLFHPSYSNAEDKKINSLNFIESIKKLRSRVQDLTAGEIVEPQFIESEQGSSEFTSNDGASSDILVFTFDEWKILPVFISNSTAIMQKVYEHVVKTYRSKGWQSDKVNDSRPQSQSLSKAKRENKPNNKLMKTKTKNTRGLNGQKAISTGSHEGVSSMNHFGEIVSLNFFESLKDARLPCSDLTFWGDC
ncbi:hypothetical protein Tco_0984733 [Tanacetum coccineum]